MRSTLFASLLAAAALFATAAHADEVVYPVQEKIFAAGTLAEDIVTPEAVFPGPRASAVKDSPGPGRGAVATSEDFLFETALPLPVKSAPARHAEPSAVAQHHDCGCPNCG
jgi:hypothetical protein